jgi:hypothetical protein
MKDEDIKFLQGEVRAVHHERKFLLDLLQEYKDYKLEIEAIKSKWWYKVFHKL